ncbi:MAG: DUF4203 domain-containing protein [Anaerolineaceae bacterium]|nr:DUF4203 domain-containing protein [Anaerolineaceae bacterium]
MIIINFILGIPLLIWGRKLFWFFVGVVGFVTGITLSQSLIPTRSEMVAIIIGVILGLVGILLAIFIQKVTISITGFLVGIYLCMTLLDLIDLNNIVLYWLLILTGGIIGSMLVIGLFDLALIILSSLFGATLITQTAFQVIQFETQARTIVFIVLLVIGLIFQFNQKSSEGA